MPATRDAAASMSDAGERCFSGRWWSVESVGVIEGTRMRTRMRTRMGVVIKWGTCGDGISDAGSLIKFDSIVSLNLIRHAR